MSERQDQSRIATVTPSNPTSTWSLHAAGSHAELCTRHWFWGRRAFTITPLQGQIPEMAQFDAPFVLTFQVNSNNRGPVAGTIRAQRLTKTGYARFEALAEIDVGGRVTTSKLLLSDYGRVIDGQGGVRRFGTISLRLPREFLAQAEWSWPRMLTGPHADLYAHLEWRSCDAAGAPFTRQRER
jgi:hypothetical protein